MDRKLTLSLNERIIARAKKYAKSHSTSLSKLIEAYLATLTDSNATQEEITPLVASLSGVIEVPDELDLKESYVEYLSEKYR